MLMSQHCSTKQAAHTWHMLIQAPVFFLERFFFLQFYYRVSTPRLVYQTSISRAWFTGFALSAIHHQLVFTLAGVALMAHRNQVESLTCRCSGSSSPLKGGFFPSQSISSTLYSPRTFSI